jgi:hypothetical protein
MIGVEHDRIVAVEFDVPRDGINRNFLASNPEKKKTH